MTLVDPEASPLEATDLALWEQELQQLQGETAATPAPEPAPPADSYVSTPVPDPASLASIPVADPVIEYTGFGPVPQWANVYDWITTTTHAATPDVAVPSPIAGTQVQHAIDAANGQTLKAVSGFINQLAALQLQVGTDLAQRITDTQNVIGAITANANATDAGLQAQLDLISNNILPHLWQAIATLNAAIPRTAIGVIEIMQTWTRENIFDPLEAKIEAEKTARIAQVDTVEQGLAGRVADIVGGLGLASAASVASIASQVDTLVAHDAECTTPMCDTMGPNTDLGKWLKALNIALDAAFIAKLLSMSESDLVDFIKSVAGYFVSFATDFEQFFTPGGGTLGDLVAKTVGEAL